jgi:predicted acetyltransferase
MDSSVNLRAATPADLDQITDLIGLTFHDRIDDTQRENERAMLELERSLIAEDRGAVVGHTTALSRDLTVPGAVVPAAHVTGVSVAPTHRRRGLLSALMRRQLTELAEAGREPIAVLWASESAIYPRFGYGGAAARVSIHAMNREVFAPRLPEAPAGRLRIINPASSVAELEAVYERLRPERVGWSSRNEAQWHHLLKEGRSKGGTELRGVLYETSDGPAGYALWRAQERWTEWGPDGEIDVTEAVADGTEAYATIWAFLLGLDLARTVRFGYAAVDEPLHYLVGDPRRLGRKLLDGLWLRLVDLPAALEARAYAAPLDVVFEVTDPIIEGNNGRWRLAGGPGKVTCARTDDAPDVACSITDLGAAYLGGTSLAALAAAGRVRRLTDNLPWAAFGGEREPNPIETF